MLSSFAPPRPPRVAEGTVVECAPGERLALPPQLPHAAAASAQIAAALPQLELWCNDNSLGTFSAGTPQVPAAAQAFDLRSPLGVTPAALLSMGAAAEVSWAAPSPPPSRQQDVQQPPPVGQQAAAPAAPAGRAPGLSKQQGPDEMFRRFQLSRREMRTEMVARLVTPSGGQGNTCAASSCTHTSVALSAAAGLPADGPPLRGHTHHLPCLSFLQWWTSGASGRPTARAARRAGPAAPRASASGARCRRQATCRWETAWSGAMTRRCRPAWCRMQVRAGWLVGRGLPSSLFLCCRVDNDTPSRSPCAPTRPRRRPRRPGPGRSAAAGQGAARL